MRVETRPRAPYIEAFGELAEREDRDWHIRLFGAAALRLCRDEESDFADLAQEIWEVREDLDPDHFVQLLVRSTQMVLYGPDPRRDIDMRRVYTEPDERVDPLYPSRYHSVEVFEEALRNISEDLDLRAEFMLPGYGFTVQSNVSDRVRGAKLASMMLRKRVGKNPRVIEVGSSQNHLMKRWQLSNDDPKAFGLEGVDIFQPTNDLDAFPDGLEPNRLVSARINGVLARQQRLKYGIGIDIMSAEDPLIRRWTRSCSFYPSELENDARVRRYDELAAREAPRIFSYRDDFVNFDHNAFRRQDFPGIPEDKKVDIGLFSAILYQLPPQQRVMAIDNIRPYLSESGVIIIQDFVSLDPNEPLGLRFHPDFPPWTYRTVLVEPFRPEVPPAVLLDWENGRCARARLGLGVQAVRAVRTQTPYVRYNPTARATVSQAYQQQVQYIAA